MMSIEFERAVHLGIRPSARPAARHEGRPAEAEHREDDLAHVLHL